MNEEAKALFHELADKHTVSIIATNELPDYWDKNSLSISRESLENMRELKWLKSTIEKLERKEQNGNQ